MLLKINYKETISLLLHIMSGPYDYYKFMGLLQYVIVDSSDESKNFILNKLQDNVMGPQIFSMLLTNGVINEYIPTIVINGGDEIIQQLVSIIYTDYWKVNTDYIYELINKREKISNKIMIMIFYQLKLTHEKISRTLLKYYKLQSSDLSESLDLYLSQMLDQEDNIKSFIALAKEYDCISELKEYINDKFYKEYYKELYDEHNERQENGNE